MAIQNAQEYYRRLRQIESDLAQLGGKVVFIKHRDTGRICQADVAPAAKALIEETHVIATEADIKAYEAQQEERAAEIKQREAARITTYILPAGTPAPVALPVTKGKS
jgi:ribosomal protein L19E